MAKCMLKLNALEFATFLPYAIGDLAQYISLIEFLFLELHKKPSDYFSAGLTDESNIFEWDICISGPPDTL